MPELESSRALQTYLNPVYPRSFPDPFVLKFDGEYFAYSTGFASDGNVFGIVRSDDLISWSEIGGAMTPLEPSPPYYWAPEVTYDNGTFYLYYSVGNETFMEIRVATSDRLDGGFVDAGRRLTTQDFAIDAHVFIDDNGARYLFYATDFLDHSHIGTGTVVDRMLDWFTLEGNPKPVTRAKYDWQVYDPNRKEKGGVRWHTVEGPAVMKRKGVYYEMFSGGNWQNTTYGVSFAVSRQLDDPDEWLQFSDGTHVMPILRTLPDLVVGPGHNCIVRGPNNRELYCVYHRWTDEGRVMAIDRMDFAGDRLFVIGPTHSPQPAPYKPALDALNTEFANVHTTGEWNFERGIAVSGPSNRAEVEIGDLPQSFLCELTMRCNSPLSDGSFGITLRNREELVRLLFRPNANNFQIDISESKLAGPPSIQQLPDDFDWTAAHRVRIEADFRKLALSLDAAAIPKISHVLDRPVESLSIFSENQSVAITAFELTEGFEELFDHSGALIDNGWEIIGENTWSIESGELITGGGEFQMRRTEARSSFELAVNFKLVEISPGEFGVALQNDRNDELRFTIDCSASSVAINGRIVRRLPAELSLAQYHQLRIINAAGEAMCYFDDILIDRIPMADVKTSSTILSSGPAIGIEMIRLTAI